jgi:crossover junction endodeoxyribonuclease RuvC
MKVLGIDPGSGLIGFGIIELTKGKPSIVDAGVIRTTIGLSVGERLIELEEGLKDILSSHDVSMAVVEKLFFAQNVTTAMNVSQARGVIILALTKAKIPISEMTPLQVKMAMTGYGKATKAQIQEMVRVQLGLKEKPKPDDCADALALALCYRA